ncbi:MAG: YhcN/YlaJ family sporulation lipoprotein [Paenisporosarcina sp.]
MKKIWTLLSATALCFALMGCGPDENEETTNSTDNNEVADETADESVDNNGGDNANLERADEAESKVTELEEVESATIIITDNNAYVAAVLQEKDGKQITEDSEELDQINAKIADQVRETNPDIENVYVSVNPDFVDQMNDYAEKIRAGEPVEGLVEEFTETAQRIFPDAS